MYIASASGNPPSLIPALRKIAILGLKTKFYVLFWTRLYYVVSLRNMWRIILQMNEGGSLQDFLVLSDFCWKTAELNYKHLKLFA